MQFLGPPRHLGERNIADAQAAKHSLSCKYKVKASCSRPGKNKPPQVMLQQRYTVDLGISEQEVASYTNFHAKQVNRLRREQFILF